MEVYGVIENTTLETPAETGKRSPADWVREELGVQLDALQARVLNSKARRGVVNCSRQWGKSTVAAAKAVHQAWHEAGSLTIVVSPSSRQSVEFMRKAAGFARKLGVAPRGDGEHEISLQFPNGSRIVGLPGTEGTMRAFSAVSLMLVDEASRIADDLYAALRPMLAGKLWLMSTPFGKRGFFWDAWERGGSKWERVRATAAECPRIAPEFLAEERQAMGERWFLQEYGCEFRHTGSGVFGSGVVECAVSDGFGPLRV